MDNQEVLKNYRVTYRKGRKVVFPKITEKQLQVILERIKQHDSSITHVEVKNYIIVGTDTQKTIYPLGDVTADEYAKGIKEWEKMGMVREVT